MKPLILNRPHLIIMVGLPGSGKSFFAEHFANTFKAPIISYSRLYKEFNRLSVDTKNKDVVIGHVANYLLGEVLKTGLTVLYDGQIYSRTDFDLITKKAHALDYEPLFVWVQTDPATSKKRATKPGIDKPALTSEQFDQTLKQFSPPERTKNIVVISGKHTYTSQLKIVLKYLAEPH
jgi:predicted kinase